MNFDCQPIERASDVMKFIHGGKSIFTLRSRKTDKHYTFKVKKKKDGVFFVYVLSEGYKYVGTILGNSSRRMFNISSKCQIDPSSEAIRAFYWSFSQISSGHLPSDLEFNHVGRCARCSRRLTHPESIKSGFGPECSSRS